MMQNIKSFLCVHEHEIFLSKRDLRTEEKKEMKDSNEGTGNWAHVLLSSLCHLLSNLIREKG